MLRSNRSTILTSHTIEKIEHTHLSNTALVSRRCTNRHRKSQGASYTDTRTHETIVIITIDWANLGYSNGNADWFLNTYTKMDTWDHLTSSCVVLSSFKYKSTDLFFSVQSTFSFALALAVSVCLNFFFLLSFCYVDASIFLTTSIDVITLDTSHLV